MMTEALQPPRPTGLIREVRGVLEFPLLVLRSVELARQPRGHGEPVLVLPGYGAGDASTAILKTYLRLLGYRVSGWHLGRSSGNALDLLPRVLRRILTMSRKSQQPVRVIGWSFGGYLAREAARERPEAIHQVITLGTPVVGGPKYTVAAHAFRRRGVDLDAMAAEIESRNKVLLQTPVTAIYSRADKFVAWEACIDHHGSNVQHIEVRTTHMGFGFSPQVYKIIAQRLADNSHVTTQRSPAKRERHRR
jgi:pimeloyl-ACP methyl ester carboxylesterase